MRKHWTWYNHWNKILGQWTTRGKNRRKGRLLLNLKNSKGKVIRKKRQKNKSELNQEEIAYESGTALNLNHNLLEQATVTPETFKEFERTVPIFTFRPPKKCPTGEISSGNFVFIVFDTETSCGGREAEILQLAAQTKQGQKFSKYTLPEKGISPHATWANKLQTTWLGDRNILHRGGIFLETVAYNEHLKSFVDFLKEISSLKVPAVPSSSTIVFLIGHNSNTFDTPLLLLAILQYCPELIQRMKDRNIHFADSPIS